MKEESQIHPRNGAKTTRQKQLSIVLFVLLVALYFGFYVVGIVSPNTLSSPVINAIPLSFVLGGAIIIASVFITFIYAFAANLIDKTEGS